MTGKRRNITYRFEYQWLLRFIMISVLGSGLLLVTLKRVFDLELGNDFSRAFATLKSMENLLLPIIGLSTLFYTVVVCILAAVITLYLSRAVAAPLFRIEGVAEHIRKGDLSFAAERQRGEQLQELLAATEELRRQYLARLRSVRPHIDAVDGSWRRITEAPPETYVQTLAQEIGGIEKELEAIARRLSS